MSGSNSSAPGASAPERLAAAGAAASAADLPSPLTLTVHALPDPRLADAELRRRTASGRLKMLLVLLACASPVIASYFAYFVVRPEGRSNYGTLIQPTRTLPEGLLADASGAPVGLAALKGQWLLVVVADGACDAACEAQLYMQRQLREMLGKERDRLDKVWIVPAGAPRPPVLAAANVPGAELTVLGVRGGEGGGGGESGPAALARWLQPEPGRALAEHLYLVDPMGEWMMRFPAGADPQRVRRDIERLLRASGSWDRAGRGG